MTVNLVNKVSARLQNSPIAQAVKLAAGSYPIQKANDDYNIIVERVNKDNKLAWTGLKESEIDNLPKDARWIMFNRVLNHKSGKLVDASVPLEFKDIPLKKNFLMTVNDKGYTNINLDRELTAKELKSMTAVTVPA